MSLWVDKYRPKKISELSLHKGVNRKLGALTKSEEFPHLLVYGPSGAGKKTRVVALLREIFGTGIEKVKLEHRTFKPNPSKTVEISTVASNFHIECNPSDVGNNDRFVIQEVIKEMASHGVLQSKDSSSSSSKSFKVVILTEVDRLSKQAQAGLRRTMEKYSTTTRLILMCNSPSKVIEPVRSRCLGIRIPAPTHDELADLLVATAKKEQCNCDKDLATKVAISSERNMRRALLMLEAMRVQCGNRHMTNDVPVQLPDWSVYINQVAKVCLEDASPAGLLKVRDMLYSLLSNCIPPDVIITHLAKELIKATDDAVKHEIAYWAAYYENRLHQGNKDIYHLEAFVAKFMAVNKRVMQELFAMMMA
jgi:replication factor C subunit 3/5